MKNLVIFGTGDIAQLADYYFTNDSDYTVKGFAVDAEFLSSDRFNNSPLVAFEQITDSFSPETHELFIALSYSEINQLRARKFLEAKDKGYKIASYISSKATVFDNVEIGENCFILENNVVQPYVRIGDNVTLWSGNHIGHHSSIDDHCFLASHIVVSGGVEMGKYVFIGVNATLRDHIKIGDSSVIGAGALIMSDTPPTGVFVAKGTKAAAITSDKLPKF
jgi:sugar O-acyltransferase (sialic acid O-acetyltransferase NeuD family)